MKLAHEEAIDDAQLLRFLDSVRDCMAQSLGATPIGRLIRDTHGFLGSGKMLRSRMAWHLGAKTSVLPVVLTHAAAAVELIHAASLLHDDVIDGGLLRRAAPTFWRKNGIPGAILLGDLLLFKAVDLTCKVDEGRLTQKLVQLTGEVCEAEAEQELVLRGRSPTWDTCLSIARRKTGALFAFIGFASAGHDLRLQAALEEAGYIVGTAYQISDDILDVAGDESKSGKTLGTDAARQKTTVATARQTAGGDPVTYIRNAADQAAALLAPWPRVLGAWHRFMQHDMQPALDAHVQSLLEA